MTRNGKGISLKELEGRVNELSRDKRNLARRLTKSQNNYTTAKARIKELENEFLEAAPQHQVPVTIVDAVTSALEIQSEIENDSLYEMLTDIAVAAGVNVPTRENFGDPFDYLDIITAKIMTDADKYKGIQESTIDADKYAALESEFEAKRVKLQERIMHLQDSTLEYLERSEAAERKYVKAITKLDYVLDNDLQETIEEIFPDRVFEDYAELLSAVDSLNVSFAEYKNGASNDIAYNLSLEILKSSQDEGSRAIAESLVEEYDSDKAEFEERKEKVPELLDSIASMALAYDTIISS